MKAKVMLSSSKDLPFVVEINGQLNAFNKEDFSALARDMGYALTEKNIMTAKQRRFNKSKHQQ